MTTVEANESPSRVVMQAVGYKRRRKIEARRTDCKAICFVDGNNPVAQH